MIAELGQFTLAWALAAAVVQALAGLGGGHGGDVRVIGLARRATLAQTVLVIIAFAALTLAHVTSNFSVLNVFENSHSAKPFVYKLSGVWGNHEGSMLLWALVLALYSGGVTLLGVVDARFNARVVGVLGLVAVAFLSFIIFTSNPFARLDPAPLDGIGLNPLLQDPGLALHPPFLYLGYVGFAVSFAFAVAALIERRDGRDWAVWARPWALTAWTFLTVGIGLGAWWAYYELGWGGFWAWDPVENASLMPWIAGAALIHTLKAVTTRGAFRSWAFLLAILAFSLSLVGTFLVRSGVLTSVHAFAVDPARGVFILLILAGAVGGSLTLYALRGGQAAPTRFTLASRETAILVNNLLLMTICATVFVGTFYPVFLDTVTGERVSVGAPYYNLVVTPFALMLLFAAGVATFLPWRRGDLGAALRRLIPAAGASLVGAVVVAAFIEPHRVVAVAAIAVATWLVSAAVTDIAARLRAGRVSIPLAVWAMNVAHIGVAIMAFGAVGAGALRTESIQFMQVGDSVEIVGERAVVLLDVVSAPGANYAAERARFAVMRGDRVLGEVAAERRYYPVRGMGTAEAGIRTTVAGDVYITIGVQMGERGWPVHISFFPFTVWLWIGVGIIGLGGALAITSHEIGRASCRERV